jgi:hypothetical protein
VHLDVLAGFVAFGVVAAGPNNLMLMTSGVKFGFGRPHLAGVVPGFSLMVALVGLDLDAVFAIAAVIPWERLRTTVAEAEALARPEDLMSTKNVEKFANLRAQLRLDDSELISLAIDELYRKHEAKRAFGDS